MDLIVRGICCILPGVTGYTDNVRVMSVVGRYLEHPRIFSFGSGNDQKIYIGSADMMTRNTEKRVGGRVFSISKRNIKWVVISLV